ncbi:uncharacterized protein PpBr36_09682 [Pyricularia pennisetigena]|uniref:uncharacterized protein n=1 Tax=Pyricularia pennisetigena TaxID=1578925 RepID=UPI0011532B1A|nr:uncharacterized protein PpBr36_09682 [Pyricularia pennisetigena]TLS22562.1 hypothetical protein PpBr36_09682 [Pyricularia pennisetigena]
MSVNFLARASRQSVRRVATGSRSEVITLLRARRYASSSTASSTGQSSSGSIGTSSVVAVALAAGLIGYGAAVSLGAGGTVRDDTPIIHDSRLPTPKYASLADMNKAIDEIRRELGDHDIISTDPDDLHAHGYSEWSTVNPTTLPVAVAYPHSTEQVAVIARICNKRRVPLIPYSGGTSLEGNFSAPFGGVSVDFAFMDKILRFSKDDMDVTVQPSIGWQDLNSQLLKMDAGLFFPIDPGPSAKIGGMVGTNCSGTNAVRYGTMRDWVINLTVVLADGSVIKTRKRPRKSSAGYNLNGLFVGSEGTLGLVTEATLKLAVIPEELSVAVVTFPSIRDAAAAAAGVMQAGVPVAAMEIMDEVQMRVVNLSGATAPRKWQETPTLFFKFSGTKAGVKENIGRVQQITKANKGSNFEFAKDEREQKLLWSARKESLWSMLALRKEGQEVFSTDVAVPFSRLADLIEVSKRDMDNLGLFASILGHIGDGNFHESIMYNRGDPVERAKVEDCVKNMVSRALEMEGTCTGEHGIGWGKKGSLLAELGPGTVGIMKAIKAALDPHWIIPTRRGPRPFQHSAISHIGVPVERWKDYTSMELKLFGLPMNITTWEIWRAFDLQGDVLAIDIFEGKFGSMARVRITPPLTDLWHGRLEIRRDVQPMVVSRVEIDPRGFKFQNEIRSPLNNPVPSEKSIRASSLSVGLMTDKTCMLVMGTIKPLQKPGDLKLEIKFSRRRLKLFFTLALLDTQDPSKNSYRHFRYQIDVHFRSITKLLRVNINQDSCFLLMPLECPPEFFREIDNKRITHDDDSLTWSSVMIWQRQVYFRDEPQLTDDMPLGLNEEHAQFMDLGRWTTYRIELPICEWSAMERYLSDYGIATQELPGFDFESPDDHPTVLWDHLEKPLTPESDNYGLEMLFSSTKVQLTWEVRYQLEACISHHMLAEPNITLEFLEKLSEMRPTKARIMLEYLVDRNVKLFDPMQLFKDESACTYWPDITPEELPQYCTMTRKVTVTPSTMYLSSPMVETTNRVLRHYSEHKDRFLRVQFTDELLTGRLHASNDLGVNDEIFNRVYRTLKNGIHIGDRHYKFLAFGSSQMRENSTYFFCDTGDITCDSIRAWMGRFSHIRNVGKYAARLGQCFSTTRSIDRVAMPWIKTIPDVERNGYCFTDGVGKISSLWAVVISESLKLSYIPSAFQFRMGGCKGVLVVWDDVKGQEIHIRPSQLKFETDHSRLEVIRCSHFSVASLNRQTISVLTSLGIKDEVFESMLAEQLTKYNRAMEDAAAATALLTQYVDENQMTNTLAQLVKAGFMESHEPFVCTMLRLWRTWSVKTLKEKARLVVEKGAFVLGCVDETKTLQGHFTQIPASPNQRPRLNGNMKLPEIFLQVPDGPGGDYKVITGLCLVGRNPSLHPGDIRVVQAVDTPQLHHIKDLVVFAQTGDRDIPGMCSGGDLDGDDFFVLWDERLLPSPSQRNFKPASYHPPHSRELDREVTADDLCQFFVTYMKNFSLPRIAHAHLAQADKYGAKDEKCLELADLHSLAVDYPKTGVPAVIRPRLMPNEFPHFMEKGGRQYHSRNILGKLYDQVKPVSFHPAYEMPFDVKVLSQYEKLGQHGDLGPKLLREARKLKTLYDQSIMRIMGQHEIATEFEVFSAFVLASRRVGSQYKLQEIVGQQSATLKMVFQEKCIAALEAASGRTGIKPRDIEALGPLVVAMYKVTDEEIKIALHECKTRGVAANPQSMPLITFPWIFDQVLVQLVTGKSNLPCSTPNLNAGSTVIDLDHPELPIRLGDLSYQEIHDIEYARTRDGHVIHRGVVLSGLFRAGEGGDDYAYDPDLQPDTDKPEDRDDELTHQEPQNSLIALQATESTTYKPKNENYDLLSGISFIASHDLQENNTASLCSASEKRTAAKSVATSAMAAATKKGVDMTNGSRDLIELGQKLASTKPETAVDRLLSMFSDD